MNRYLTWGKHHLDFVLSLIIGALFLVLVVFYFEHRLSNFSDDHRNIVHNQRLIEQGERLECLNSQKIYDALVRHDPSAMNETPRPTCK